MKKDFPRSCCIWFSSELWSHNMLWEEPAWKLGRGACSQVYGRSLVPVVPHISTSTLHFPQMFP